MTDRLAGRIAIVMGGGQTPGETIGNGRAVAVGLARAGAHVAVCDVSAEAAESTAEQISEEGGSARAYRVDVTDPDSVRAAVDAVHREHGRIDVLHNNVGILGAGDIEHQDEEAWRRTWDVNLDGMWRACKAVLPVMREQGSGAVVNISSLASFGTGAAGANLAYATSKAAINTMTRALAMQYAPHGVRVNAIAPGLIDTPMGVQSTGPDSSREDALAARLRLIPMRRHGSAWDIANAAVFLASDDAAFITGVVLPVDGGSSLMQNLPQLR